MFPQDADTRDSTIEPCMRRLIHCFTSLSMVNNTLGRLTILPDLLNETSYYTHSWIGYKNDGSIDIQSRYNERTSCFSTMGNIYGANG